MYLAGQGHDVRDVCPTRTAERGRQRRQGKSDHLDSERIARETQAHPAMPTAFKRAAGDAGPDETHELIALWHKARRSIPGVPTAPPQRGRATPRRAAPKPFARHCRTPKVVRPRLQHSLLRQLPPTRTGRRGCGCDCLKGMPSPSSSSTAPIATGGEFAASPSEAGSTLQQLCGIGDRIEAELLVEVGDPRRFTGEGGFARFNGPPRCRPRRPKATANRSATASTGRQPTCQRLPLPDRRHPAPLQPPRPDDLRRRPPPRSHQERSHAHPQASTLQRRLPTDDPRPATTTRRRRPAATGSVNHGLLT